MSVGRLYLAPGFPAVSDRREEMRAQQMQSTHSVLGPIRCIICYEDTHDSSSLSCASGHAVCNGCFGTYLHERAGALSNTDLLASKAETAELLGNATVCDIKTDLTTAASAYAAQAEAFAGKCHCPLRGHGCVAPPFTDRQVAVHADDEAFEACARAQLELSAPLAPPERARPWADVQAKSLLPAAKRLQQLASLFPNARQCGRCGWGPVELAECDDLTAYHGQQIRWGSSVRIDNACHRCGWFSPDIKQWPVRVLVDHELTMAPCPCPSRLPSGRESMPTYPGAQPVGPTQSLRGRHPSATQPAWLGLGLARGFGPWLH